MSTTAKVKVVSKTPYYKDAEQTEVDQVSLTFMADYDDGRNKEWAKYTPGLSVQMTVKPEVAEQFNTGDAFTLTFEKSE